MPQLDLSIIIVNYNTFAVTCDCISSIYATIRDLAFEIIVVDNCSSEHDANEFKQKFPDIRLIASPLNVGYAKGNNLGIEVAESEYLLLLNSDILLTEDSTARCLEYFKSDKTIGALSPKLIYPDGRPQSVANRFPSIFRNLLFLTRLFKVLSRAQKDEYLLGEYVSHKTTISADWIIGAYFLTSRTVLNSLPGNRLSDDFFMYYEDVEWCYEMKKLGYKIVYFPHTEAIHLGSASQSKLEKDPSKPFKKYELMCRNEVVFLRRQKGLIYQVAYTVVSSLMQFSAGNFMYGIISLKALAQ